MSGFKLQPEFIVADEDSLRHLYDATHALALQKERQTLSANAFAFIRRSPFLCIGTQGPGGRADVSPRGDAPGFVTVFDDRTLAIPDRPGNNRLDTLANVVANPSVGLLFLIPGFDETLRINGRATLTTQPDLLDGMAVNERRPKLAIVVAVEEVFLHCAKAFRRSHLWDPEHRQDRQEMPSLMQMILDDTTGAPVDPAEMRKMDENLETAYQKTLY
ncbi:MAG: pyridoxamine 5'-phosphate oxidase family protein [Rhizobium rhizophilum]|uniref:pyridoxamine 5'-phosphate oxidase family protein n=1 Tax=Rhizobium rhizophilum TaxID=1850373 RepID=UPI00391D5FC5